MAKTIKFNLICDNTPVRTIEDLQNNFSIEDVLDYYRNGLLCRWLKVRGYEEELKKVEEISPCVLWIDEIEKAFAGVGGEGGGNDVTTRLFGQFLTWMQEKENTVFIVATANDISRLPPEFLRKGRFDELFFVDLPNGTERRKILEIHLKKRKKWNENIDSIALIKETEGYNGADLEAVVKDTIERAFIEGRTTITTADLIRSIKDTKSISCTLKDKIASIQKTVEKIDIKPASLDDKKEKEPDPSQVYMKAAKAKV